MPSAKKPSIWSLTREELLRAYTEAGSVNRAAAALGFSRKTVSLALSRSGVAQTPHREACRKIRLDESVFDEPSEEGRYWAGFLMADGGIVKDKRHDSWQVVLAVSECDADHVRAFASLLKTDAAVQLRPASKPTRFPQGHASTSAPHVRLSVTSKRLAESLARFGVVPKKSATAKCVGLESCMHFWRGAVDGDGFLSWHKTNGRTIPLIGFCGSEPLVTQFREFCVGVAGRFAARVRKVGPTLFNIRIAGTPAVAIIRALYETDGRALPRKAALAREMMGWVSRYPAKSS